MKTMLKRVLASVFAIIMLFSFSSCIFGKNGNNKTDNTKQGKTFVITSETDMTFAQNMRGVFTVNDIFENFKFVTVDGKELTKKDFYVSSTPVSEGGFIQVTLLETFLSSLDTGDHKIQVITKNGKTKEIVLKVTEPAPEPEEVTEPETTEPETTEPENNDVTTTAASQKADNEGNKGTTTTTKKSSGTSTTESEEDELDYVPLTDAEMSAIVSELESYAASQGYVIDHTLGLDNGNWGSAYLLPPVFTAETRQEEVNYLKQLIRENDRCKDEGYDYIHMRVVLYKDNRCTLPGQWMIQDVYYGWHKVDPAFPIDLVRHEQKRIYFDDGSWTSKPIYGTAYHFVNGWKQSISEEQALEYARAYETREYGYFFEQDYLDSFVYE